MEQSTLQRLNGLGDALQALYIPIQVTRYTSPLNRADEKQRLFAAHAAGKEYNPQYIYEPTPTGWDQPLHSFLTTLRPEANEWETLIHADIVRTLTSMKAAETHDPTLITAETIRGYGEPSPALVCAAREVLEISSIQPDERTIPVQEVADLMRNALGKAGLNDWSVVITSAMQARMSVRAVEKQLKIHDCQFFTDAEMTRLLVHEIGTHVFRAVNGELEPLRLLRFGFDNYLLTEEGLATYHEARFGVQNGEDQRRYALRVLAAHLSLVNSFYEVFCAVAAHTTTEEAFEIVMRAKRGFTDTKVHGAHVKDKVYFEGYQKVSAHLRSHPEDYPLLMCGKVSIEMVSSLRQLCEDGLLVEPKYLPEMLV